MSYGAAFDISVWRSEHDVCPYCHVSFRDIPPEANLVPHWLNNCQRLYTSAEVRLLVETALEMGEAYGNKKGLAKPHVEDVLRESGL